MANIEAAEQALYLFNKIREGGDDDIVDTLETDIVDLITDLLHLLRDRGDSGVDPLAFLTSARNHYQSEIYEMWR